jgi:hypothetical protein
MAVFYTITPTHRMVFALGSAVRRERACLLADSVFNRGFRPYLFKKVGLAAGPHLIVELLL